MSAGSARKPGTSSRPAARRAAATPRPTSRPAAAGTESRAPRAPTVVPRNGAPARPLTRAERREAAKARRARLGLAISVVASIAIVAAWFPASELAHQRQQLATATTQLDQLRQQDHALAQEQKRLKNPAEIARIAREDYQLVSPGSTPYQVLPPSSSSSSAAPYPTDPGLSKPVVPSGDVELPVGNTAADHRSSVPATTSGFFGRVLKTLEFWR